MIYNVRSDLHSCFEDSGIVGEDDHPFLFAHFGSCGGERAEGG